MREHDTGQKERREAYCISSMSTSTNSASAGTPESARDSTHRYPTFVQFSQLFILLHPTHKYCTCYV